MRILLVEDSPSDRQILRYLLDAQFKGNVEFYEAPTLAEAVKILETRSVDCVVLDLQLPDSVGRRTFQKLNKRFPNVPLVVMTHSKDRQMALEMIQEGAADFVIKSYSDEEDIFRRVMFAIEKHRRSVRVLPEEAQSYHNLEQAKSNLEEASFREESPSIIRNMTVEVTTAVADLSRRMFTQLQEINLRLTQLGTQQEVTNQTVNDLDKELLRGHSSRPSMRSQVDLIDHRVKVLEGKVGEIEDEVDGAEEAQVQLVKTKMSNRTKIIIGILTLLGVLGTSLATYFTAVHKPHDPSPVPSASKP